MTLGPHDPQTTGQQLTRSPLLAKNTLLNLMGYGAPALVAVFAIPLIVASLGTDRFGILSLAWVLIGYLSLLDLGLGRALTKLVAEKLGTDATDEIPGLIWAALAGMVILSVAIGLLLVFLSAWAVNDLLKIPAELRQEAGLAFRMLAVFVPVVIISVAFRGVLEAYQRFDLVNVVRMPLGIFSFAAPLAVIPFTTRLPAIILVLLAGRLIAAGLQFLFCCRIVPGLLTGFGFSASVLGRLVRFGSWMTVTNVVHPLLVYSDRFFIGAMLSVGAVAFYATPSEVITQLALISGAFLGVMFPAFSASYGTARPHSAFLLDRSLKYVFMFIFPLACAIVCFAPEGLHIWLDAEFSRQSTRVSQILALGVLFTCLGQMPYAFIQGAGRPDLTGWFHLCQLPLYLLLLAGAVQWAGINGAALVWSVRAMVDGIGMYLIAQHLLGGDRLGSRTKIFWLLAGVTIAALLAFPIPLHLRSMGFGGAMLLYLLVGMRYLLSADEIGFLKGMVKGWK